MDSHNFLRSVADYYCNAGIDLSGLTMVFPNKRAAMFMRMYFKERLQGVNFMPRMVSISYFTQMMAGGSQLASPVEQLFTLYDCYRRVLTRHGREDEIRDFDTFIFWGTIILRDFDDADAYMVDTEMLFRNLRDVKEIQSNYLTDAQLEVVRELWGTTPSGDLTQFWRHVGASDPDNPDSRLKAGFLSLWHIMGELYDEFTRALASRPVPMATSGCQSRRACERIRQTNIHDLGGCRYAFVGFNVLSTARTLIFKHLQKLGAADFFWDIVSPFFSPDATGAGKYAESFNKASKFILPLSNKFPMPDGYEPPHAAALPEIEIISSPSNVAQVKTASLILNSWMREGVLLPGRLLSTAVVLNDNSLLTPMLNSIDPAIDPINVTLGLSYESTPLAAFLSGIFRMHLRRGLQTGHYYYDDVNEVISHPYVAAIAPEEADALRGYIRQQRLYNVPAAEIMEQAPHLAFIFRPISDSDVQDSISFMRQLTERLTNALTTHADSERSTGYEINILEAYAGLVDDLCSYIERFSVAMHKQTFFLTLERSLSKMKINFSGKPIVGLQIMGMADTRALDFENVIVLSMNERIFPRRVLRPSFIPENLRAGYAMPTLDFEESTAAYRFYRLISRARRVRLMYDNRTKDNVSGEMSRFLYQLSYMPCGCNVTHRGVNIAMQPAAERVLEVHKTPEVLEALRRFSPDARQKRYFSASALKTYLNCPLQFYLKYVRGLRDEDTPEAYINASLTGTIFHEIARYLYDNAPSRCIDRTILQQMLSSDLDSLALRMISHHGYAGRYDKNPSMVPGEGHVLAGVMVNYIKAMLRAEQSLPAFTFLESEMGEGVKQVWKVDSRHTINFKMSVDRVDMLSDGALRFIDYKTGADEISADSVEMLFKSPKKSGMLQLMTYCEAYADIRGYTGAIYPKIYKTQDLITKGIPELRLNRSLMGDYRQYHDTFRPMLNDLIHRIFEENDEYPFTPAADSDNCRYCFFAQMCGRIVKDK